MATEKEEWMMKGRLAAIAAAASQRKYMPCGRCHYCDEAVRPGSVFCDRECSDAQASEDAARQRNLGPRR